MGIRTCKGFVRCAVGMAVIAGVGGAVAHADAPVGEKLCTELKGKWNGNTNDCTLPGRTPFVVKATGKTVVENDKKVLSWTVTSSLGYPVKNGNVCTWYYDRAGKLITVAPGHVPEKCACSTGSVFTGPKVDEIKPGGTETLTFMHGADPEPPGTKTRETEVTDFFLTNDKGESVHFGLTLEHSLGDRPKGGWKP